MFIHIIYYTRLYRLLYEPFICNSISIYCMNGVSFFTYLHFFYCVWIKPIKSLLLVQSIHIGIFPYSPTLPALSKFSKYPQYRPLALGFCSWSIETILKVNNPHIFIAKNKSNIISFRLFKQSIFFCVCLIVVNKKLKSRTSIAVLLESVKMENGRNMYDADIIHRNGIFQPVCAARRCWAVFWALGSGWCRFGSCWLSG